jgi:hypothetical protein
MMGSLQSRLCCALAVGCTALAVSGTAFAGPPSHSSSSSHGAAAANGASSAGKPSDGTPPGLSKKGQAAGSASGIVQSVAADAVVVKELDGSAVSVPVGPSTRVFVDGARASLAAVQPGFVVSTSWSAGKPTAELLVFDPSANVGVVQSVSEDLVVATDSAGRTVTVRVTPRTRVLVDGAVASLRSVSTGYTLLLSATRAAKSAVELRFLRPS